MAQVWDDEDDQERPAGALPDRTPPSKAWRYTGKRLEQGCAICGGAYLIAPSMAKDYHTCSPACTHTLRSQQRSGRPWSERRRAAAGNEGRRMRWEC